MLFWRGRCLTIMKKGVTTIEQNGNIVRLMGYYWGIIVYTWFLADSDNSE